MSSVLRLQNKCKPKIQIIITMFRALFKNFTVEEKETKSLLQRACS